MFTLRKADSRGKADFGWLQSQHTFSFGSYYDPQHMGVSSLRVINDDRVAPSAGFDTHGHRDMEIISFVTHGVIEHKDSMGNIQRLPKGEFQLMSAGKGVFHSEYNGSDEEELTFLQIWITPSERGGEPSYQQKHFGEAIGLTTVITPDGREGTLQIKQDTTVSQLRLDTQTRLEHTLNSSRTYYVHVIEGELLVESDSAQVRLESGDGLTVRAANSIAFTGQSAQDVAAILFDLP
ncbi:pirin family protein [Aestuariibacter sp. AA17]|uniref:Pirin family protein n=1 Tax=Fluctibacter corallii TaxID=2984329 RepID=A0ABT3AAJ1_9ALTE|nr:pirin family protein [Aestuariibacter sp. AA17]MCV2885670.1 pirin family protein [Aestuariibacter sp. AA17]